MRADPVVYQVYPRSFQDSDGDGTGDLDGVRARLGHVARLGADAVWLSPIHPSPGADLGYDIADFDDVDVLLGGMAAWERLRAEADRLGLALLLDLVPCHTSIAHPWFRARPDFYFWRDAPANNWRSAFGGSAWVRDGDTGRFFLSSYFPEQADLDWRNPAVVAAMQGVVRRWRERGAAGFRLDALQGLLKDPELRDDPPAACAPVLPTHPEHAALDHVRSQNAPDVGEALAALRTAAGTDAWLVGEVFLPTALLRPYLGPLDAAFALELLHTRVEPAPLRAAIAAAYATGKAAWVLSNHDFARLATRAGRANERVLAMLLLTLPGPVFIYQGDEIGLGEGPGAEEPVDRFGRDAHRHPMQWDASPSGGFTTGEPWLPLVDPPARSVAAQEEDRGSLLWLYRDLIALRPELGPGLAFRDSAPGTLVLERGAHLVVLNLGGAPAPAPAAGELRLPTSPAAALEPGRIAPHSGWIARRSPWV